MNKLVLLLLCLCIHSCVFACSAPDTQLETHWDDGEGYIPPEREAELQGMAEAEELQGMAEEQEFGQARLAATYVLHPDFGKVVNSQGSRCNHRSGQQNYSSSTPCIHPARRNLSWCVDPSLQNPSFQTVYNYMRTGMTRAALIANIEGWNLTEVQQGGNCNIFMMLCSCAQANAQGCAGSAYSGSGPLRTYVGTSICVDLAKFGGSPVQRVENVATHETGHALGLGHNPTSSPCSQAVMHQSMGTTACGNTFTTSRPSFAPVERDMLDIFDVL